MGKFESSPVTKTFLSAHQKFLTKENRIIVGVSGGPDSMALLYLLHRTDTDSVAVHCNYGLRGKDSDKDQELVEEMCKLWEIECVAVRPEIDKNSGNFQNKARDERYRIFEELKSEYGADYIATAHHRDDQVETILQKLLRGAGMGSWKAMSPLDGEFFRPLLDIPKSEILNFVQLMNVPFRMDGSNEESTYARNFLRHAWFPDLSRLFPGWKENLLRLPDRADEYTAMADTILAGCLNGTTRLNRDRFLSLPDTIRQGIMHRFLEKSIDGLSVSAAFLNTLNTLDSLQTGNRISINERYDLLRDRDEFVLSDTETAESSFQKVVIQQNHLQKIFRANGLILRIENFNGSFDNRSLKLDSEKVAFPVTLRRWKEGDQFTPLGMDGTQRISDHLTNRKISSAEKSDAFVLESFDGVIVAVIFPHSAADGQIGTISEQVRCSDNTQTTVTIRKS
ncbi:tRNA lysidine(34) synthetase TilS [Rhodohalobacter mucosus]|uniref:tRNA(Ile)-lysidine synthase n=1 Tax=Rhodohalobacter mucosus TaxID=2079485 RepID=A0A316TU73_9BACT|nr:tRNA lysidine(34) synthetase TilS [Rhodohalobacter mucosus]PWN07368.1 tRNA lysidine(34) synthetase TilS [Rhodohalobacter mucosus]